ncbi:hypothetical protein JCM24511_00329 [Saitozyma sp. JCM 24511]|nr:hypothetical protein JCM24511_00329 [Saitozyma sp. JCM 24511]
MATSLIVPLAYITVLVTSLAIFSRVYRRRRAVAKTSFEPWFPAHPTRDIYITLLSSPSPVPDSLLKSALLVRATADVRRIWRLRDDKAALTSLHQRGLIGDDTMERFAAAEKELEAEIVDVVQEAHSFRQGWGGMIFATATEMAQAEKTRETVMNIPKIKAMEDKRQALRAKYLPDIPASSTVTGLPIAPSPPISSTPSRQPSAPGSGSDEASAPSPAGVSSAIPLSGTTSATSTPSKNTPGKKKKGKK